MIAVLDFGSQYTHLITRRIRSLGAKAEILESGTSPEVLEGKGVTGIILSGGPNSVYDKDAPAFDKKILEMNIPVLGICYGHQLIAYSLGVQVQEGNSREYGEEVITVKKRRGLFEGLGERETVWFSHGDEVKNLPEGFETLASTQGSEVAAFASKGKNIYGIQFHPEVVHTKNGIKILENFVFKICGHPKDWEVANLKQNIISELKKEIKDKKVIIGVSGGVDSLVASVLLKMAIGENLYCVFIDTGFMRKNEPKEVENLYLKLGFENFILVQGSKDFLKALEGISDPEGKRKAFSKEYFLVFERVVKELRTKEGIEFLAQGTIYPDRIEAGRTSKVASIIKSHHNTTLPENLGFKLIEPLKDLYKDEVRSLGKELSIPQESLERHPFPGPGLLIRVLGEVDFEKLEVLREADAIFIEELKRSGEYQKIWQAFTVLLGKSVGVMGDERTYEHMVVLRAVTSLDAMTADWARIPEELLNKISKRITNEVRGINRVLFDITQKPPSTIEYE